MIDQDVRQAIQNIYYRDGEVTASAVLTDAADPNSPLHRFFEWDQERAAHAYRLNQAMKLIRKVQISVRDESEPERLIHIPSTEKREGSYKPVSVIAESRHEFELALSEALSKLRSAQRAVDDLRRAAERSDDDQLAKITLAYEALSTANEALRAVH